MILIPSITEGVPLFREGFKRLAWYRTGVKVEMMIYPIEREIQALCCNSYCMSLVIGSRIINYSAILLLAPSLCSYLSIFCEFLLHTPLNQPIDDDYVILSEGYVYSTFAPQSDAAK